MRKETKKIYNDKIRNEAASLYGVSGERLQELEGFESFVYGYEQNGLHRILKVSHSLHKSVAHIRGEMDWLNYLAGRGIAVAPPVPSEKGDFVEVIELEDSYFSVMAFEKAEGAEPEQIDWTPEFLQSWGRFMGRLHASCDGYKPARADWKRQEWHEESLFRLRDSIPSEQMALIERGERLIETVRSLPVERESYGLIHADLHTGNFLVHNGVLTAFDFDDAEYSYFANDIAIAIYHCRAVIVEKLGGDEAEAMGRFLEHFLRGYSQAYRLDECWLQEIPDFLRLRRLLLYVVVLAALDPEHQEFEGYQAFLEKSGPRILANTPVVDFDFGSLRMVG